MALFQLLLLVSFGMEAGGTLHYKLDAIGMVLPISEMGRLSKIRLSKILHEVDSESLVTKSASAKVLNVGPGRLKWCFTSCTGTMSRCWQYLFDIHIINGQLDMDELRSSMFRLRHYLNYAEPSSTLDPWPVDRRSVGYHDGKNSLGGDPLQNFSLLGTAHIHTVSD